MNQIPTFPLPALSSTLRNILDVIVILFYFFLNKVLPYKTLFLLQVNGTVNGTQVPKQWDLVSIKSTIDTLARSETKTGGSKESFFLQWEYLPPKSEGMAAEY